MLVLISYSKNNLLNKIIFQSKMIDELIKLQKILKIKLHWKTHMLSNASKQETLNKGYKMQDINVSLRGSCSHWLNEGTTLWQ